MIDENYCLTLTSFCGIYLKIHGFLNPQHSYLLRQCKKHKIATLAIDESSLFNLPKLLPYHRDPFDRILICQAMFRRLTLVSIDPSIRAYAQLVPVIPEE